LSIPLRTTRNNSEDQDFIQAEPREGAVEWAARRAGEDRDPGQEIRRPRLLPRQMDDAPRDAWPAVDIGNLGERGAQLVRKERKMGAGKHDRVDLLAVRRVEHRPRGR